MRPVLGEQNIHGDAAPLPWANKKEISGDPLFWQLFQQNNKIKAQHVCSLETVNIQPILDKG